MTRLAAEAPVKRRPRLREVRLRSLRRSRSVLGTLEY
jgi:hypothetical protein